MKKMNLNYTNRNFNDVVKKSNNIRISLDEKNENILQIRNTEYDPEKDVHNEIEPVVHVHSGNKSFVGSWWQFVNKLTKPEIKGDEMIVEMVFNHINNFSFNPKSFVEFASRQHRTLQQTFTNLCFAWIRHLASLKENQYDGRNEYSVKVAKEIVEKVENVKYNLPMI